jgi:hypothetical protein
MKLVTQRNNPFITALLLSFLGIVFPVHLQSQTAKPEQSPTASELQRHYQEGEKIAYKMTGVNQGRQRTIRYEARAEGLVKKAPSSAFFEEFAWPELRLNGQPFLLSPDSLAFREPLCLTSGYTLTVPDLSKVQPILIGPITDLLAFYADTQLAMGQKGLARAGDHVYVKNGVPSSWADGTYIVLGQDSIDFDITLQSIDQKTNIATMIVRHVPPAQTQIKFPADWMQNSVSDTANNWVEVEKRQDGKFAAQVGKETFEANIKIALATGRVISATMDNPVVVMERDCNDAALSDCGEPARFSIRRQITLEAQP